MAPNIRRDDPYDLGLAADFLEHRRSGLIEPRERENQIWQGDALIPHLHRAQGDRPGNCAAGKTVSRIFNA